MMRILGSVMLCVALQGSAYAQDFEPKGNALEAHKEVESLKLSKNLEGKSHHRSSKGNKGCCPGATGPKGPNGAPGDPGPDFDQYACLYSNTAQTLTTGQNVRFGNQISLSGITYDGATGIFTLQPGTYSVTYFSTPISALNLVVNGSDVPNSPLGGCATILTLSNATNTLALQAQSSTTLPAPGITECNAMITIYQID